MTYPEALQYLESFINYEKIDTYNYRSSLKLDRMERFSDLLGSPQKYTRAIHIAGTKGKGSVAAFTHSILMSAGFKAGLYTSPHLIDFRERIRIDNELISEEDLASILDRIRDTVEGSMKDDRPSFFEVYTALAYIYFKEKGCDFAVYETGLGGRLDATNVIEPLACAITPLSYEHTDKLGNTLEEIAREKCGIIKPGSICVSAPQGKEALKIIERVCRDSPARLILVGRDILVDEVHSAEDEEVFNVLGILGEYPLLKTRLIGSHQMVNAATAIGLIEGLMLRGITISSGAVREGIKGTRWQGRLEIVNRNPYIVLDGAQNRASAESLASAVKKIFKYRRLILVLGVSMDKDIKGILATLVPISDSIILTKSKVASRSMAPEKIKEAAENMRVPQFLITYNVEDALKKALAGADKDDLILVTGSLFVVGDAIAALPACRQAGNAAIRLPTAAVW